ncbi:13000_t:CDS:2 [Funneliformis geosporum]|uniref:13000_t:CDS:1 n=1 Tax=Funneliformis geosporum TaxID=1117311 RepID=A0A9W4SYY9_9GLOM|nr:13000_t:CDS:2 [Funneliformis geosporum]
MASPHLWTPALEPRTIINPWYRHAIINETIALDREEEDYEAQLYSIRVKELGDEIDDDAEEIEGSEYTHHPDSTILGEILGSTEVLPPSTPPGETSRAMDISEFEVLGVEEYGQDFEF